MKYTVQDIVKVVGGKFHLHDESSIEIEHLLTDSRKIISSDTSLFFAIIGVRHDGHRFIDELLRSVVKNFVVSHYSERYADSGCNFIVVDDALVAMQQLA